MAAPITRMKRIPWVYPVMVSTPHLASHQLARRATARAKTLVNNTTKEEYGSVDDHQDHQHQAEGYEQQQAVDPAEGPREIAGKPSRARHVEFRSCEVMCCDRIPDGVDDPGDVRRRVHPDEYLGCHGILGCDRWRDSSHPLHGPRVLPEGHDGPRLNFRQRTLPGEHCDGRDLIVAHEIAIPLSDDDRLRVGWKEARLVIACNLADLSEERATDPTCQQSAQDQNDWGDETSCSGLHRSEPTFPGSSEGVVELEFVWMWPNGNGLDLGAFESYPGIDQIGCEDIACQQELVIRLQGIQHCAQAGWHGGDLGMLLGRQLVEVLVDGGGGLDAVLDAVQSCQQDGGEGQVGVARWIWATEFDALGLRIGAGDRDTDAGRTVTGRVDQVDRCLEAGN